MMSNFLPEIGGLEVANGAARRGVAIFRVLSSARGIFVT